MPDKTFTAAVLDADDVNTYCTHTGDAWNTWTPAWVQSATVTHTVTYARYHRTGRKIVAQCNLVATGSGTSSNIISLSVPVNHVHGTNGPCIGTVSFSDVSGNLIYFGLVFPLSSSTVFFIDIDPTPAQRASGAANMGVGANTFSAAVASGDILKVELTYEAAS